MHHPGKKLFAVAALSAALAAGAASPAHAGENFWWRHRTDASVGMHKTGGEVGKHGHGYGYLKNSGSRVLPKGTSFIVDFHDMHGHRGKHHGDVFSKSDLIVIRIDVHKWRLVTTKDLYPGHKIDYDWKIDHDRDSKWSRVIWGSKVEHIPGDKKDDDRSNDECKEDGDGKGV